MTGGFSSETCKYMLACLVHKNNMDISCKPTKLAPGCTRKDARKEKEHAVAKECAKAKSNRPLTDQECFGDVELAIKKARVEGMRSHSEKITINTIVAQVNLLRENQAFYQEVHGEEKYRAMIVNHLNKLPGVPAPAVPESVSQEGESLVRRAPGSSRKGMEVTIPGEDNFSLSAEEDE